MARIPEIKLSADETSRLIRVLERMRQEGETLHHNWERLHDGYLRQYRCIPEVSQRMWPGGGVRSNLFLPITRAVIDAYMAQQFDAMFSQERIVEAKPIGANGQNVADAELISKYYDEYLFKKVIPMREIGNDYLFDLDLDGTACMKVRYETSQERKRTLVLRRSPDIIKEAEEVDGIRISAEIVAGEREDWVEEDVIEPINKPVIDVVDLARLRIAPDTVENLQWPNCRWYYEIHNIPWEGMLERRRMGYENIDDKLKAQLSVKEGTDRDDTNRKAEDLSESENPRTVEVEEFYMRWPLPGRISYTDVEGKTINRTQGDVEDEEAFWEEVIVTYLPQVQKISRIRPLGRVYPNNKRPHIAGRFIRLPRLFYGLGLAEKMQQLNAFTNSSFNQMMDYGSLQNMPYFFYTPAVTGPLPDVIGIRPGGGIPVNDARGIQMTRFQGDSNFWLSAMAFVQAFVERDSAITDFNLGRQGPGNMTKTARGTQMLLQQSNIAFSRQVAMQQAPFIEAIEMVHALQKRHSPEWLEFAVLNEQQTFYQKARLNRRSLEQELDLNLILNPNQSAEQQKAQNVLQMTLMVISQAAQNPMLLVPARSLLGKFYDTMGIKGFDEIWPPMQMELPSQQTQGPPPASRPAKPIKENAISVDFNTGSGPSSDIELNQPGEESLT